MAKPAISTLMAGAIAASLGTSCFAEIPIANASEGSITIHQRANADARYIMYQVFVADISENDIATHIAWNPDNKDATIAFLDSDVKLTGAATSYSAWLAERGKTGASAHDNAQNAAEYISEMIAASANAAQTEQSAIKKSGSFAENLGQYLAANGSPAEPATATAGTSYVNAEGYYLAVSSPSSIGENEVGSTPMWIPLGGSMQTIDAKEEAPSLAFHVMDDRVGSAWGKAADACMGQDLAFRVQGSLPSGIEAYDRYHDRYVVKLPDGMALSEDATSSVAVKVAGSDVTNKVDVIYANGTLAVDVDDAKALVRELGGNSIEITFNAHLKDGANIGEAGNIITVERTYTADPVTLAERATLKQAVSTYAYGVQAVKVDKSNGEHLAGAKFTMRVSDGTALDKDGQPSAQTPSANTDTSSIGKYLQADGSLGDAPYEFESDQSGELLMPAVDEGVYIIREASAPEGYEPQDTDIVLTLTSELDQSEGGLSSLSAHVTGGEAANVTGDETSRVLSVSKSSGIVRLQAADDRMLSLAGTGLQGNGMLFVAAGVLAGVGTTGLATTGRKRNGRK